MDEAQQDMRLAYFYGVPGIICSGTAWLIAGMFGFFSTEVSSIAALVIGGMFIFPVSVLLCKLMGYSGKLKKSNPLAPLALEGTVWMLLSIVIAIALAFHQTILFFPAMLLVIAGRYLTFSTLYGMRIYYALSIGLVSGAMLLVFLKLPLFAGGIIGGTIEILFAGYLVFYARSRFPLAKVQ